MRDRSPRATVWLLSVPPPVRIHARGGLELEPARHQPAGRLISADFEAEVAELHAAAANATDAL